MPSPKDIDDLNCLIRFLARRDLEALSADALFRVCGARQADRLILMGGITTPVFAEMAAEAYHRGLAAGLMVVGGKGHSTQNLRDRVAVHSRYRTVVTADRPEADILCAVLTQSCGVPRERILVERASTNCGNNASLALEVARGANRVPRTAILIQDPIMQRRTHESFLQAWRTEPTVFRSFAPAIPLLRRDRNGLAFAEPEHDLYYGWSGFLDLVMGEIPRLRDDAKGYGPRGAGFIGHVDIPEPVLQAFDRLLPGYSQHVRPKHDDGPALPRLLDPDR